eukprot:gene10508-19227_t
MRIATWNIRNMNAGKLRYNPVNDRVLSVRLQGRSNNITIVQVYAPTSAANEEEIERFYESVQQVLDRIPANETLILMGDFNAKKGEGCDPNVQTATGKWSGKQRKEGI